MGFRTGRQAGWKSMGGVTCPGMPSWLHRSKVEVETAESHGYCMRIARLYEFIYATLTICRSLASSAHDTTPSSPLWPHPMCGSATALSSGSLGKQVVQFAACAKALLSPMLWAAAQLLRPVSLPNRLLRLCDARLLMANVFALSFCHMAAGVCARTPRHPAPTCGPTAPRPWGTPP